MHNVVFCKTVLSEKLQWSEKVGLKGRNKKCINYFVWETSQKGKI
jgi:hypothetical protein